MGGPGDLLAAVDVAGYGAGGPGMRGPVPGPVVWWGVRNWNQVNTTCHVKLPNRFTVLEHVTTNTWLTYKFNLSQGS